jgi:MYXO-CTERM domain-containing protein
MDSVGSSGGLMGLFGFLGVMGWRRRHLMPPGFVRAVLVDVAVIAAMGVVGYQFIDNAAHAGGLAAGVLLGLLMVPTRGTTPYWEPPRYIRRAGGVSLAILLLAAAGTVIPAALLSFADR